MQNQKPKIKALIGLSLLTAVLCTGCSYNINEQVRAASECKKEGMKIHYTKNIFGQVTEMNCVGV